MEKREKDQRELCAKLQQYRAKARERDEWKKKYEDLQIAFKEEEIKHLKELYMARVSQVSPEVLATMNSSDGSRDTSPKTKAQGLCGSREPMAPQQISQSAPNPRNTIPDPSDTYLAPQFQESFNQVVRAAINEINRTTGRTLVGSSLLNALIVPRVARSEHLELQYQRGIHMAERLRNLA